jgi:cyclase
MLRGWGRTVGALSLVLGIVSTARAQRDFSRVEIQAEAVAPGITMLVGAGGNIGVFAGPDGVVLIDDQYAPLTEKIRKAVRSISDAPIRFVLNTHWHHDHTGGNQNLAGEGVLIFAHDNVRRRLTADQLLAATDPRATPNTPEALPIVTFDQSVTFHLNGDTVMATHFPHAHTDGDVIVFFSKANVVHMGDCFFNGIYPFIDVDSGGSIDGLIAAVEAVLAGTDAETRFIPGHGPLADRAALQTFHSMLVGVRDRVTALVREGKSLDEVQAAKPTAAWDAVWGTGWVKPENFVEKVFAGVSRG